MLVLVLKSEFTETLCEKRILAKAFMRNMSEAEGRVLRMLLAKRV